MGNKRVLALRKQLQREQLHVQWLSSTCPLTSAQQRTTASRTVSKCWNAAVGECSLANTWCRNKKERRRSAALSLGKGVSLRMRRTCRMLRTQCGLVDTNALCTAAKVVVGDEFPVVRLVCFESCRQRTSSIGYAEVSCVIVSTRQTKCHRTHSVCSAQGVDRVSSCSRWLSCLNDRLRASLASVTNSEFSGSCIYCGYCGYSFHTSLECRLAT